MYQAFEESRKGKVYKHQVMNMSLRAEIIVSDLVRELRSGEYKPGGFYNFESRKEVKRRIINAPLFRDCVVQHAVCNALNEIFEKKFIYDSYANRTDKGNHKAVARVHEYIRQSKDGIYVLQGDYSKYYENILHDDLKADYRRTIVDKRMLWLIDLFIDSYNSDIDRGIPLGAPLSQLSGNVHLNTQDHFIKDGLRVKKYVRLMDDFIIIGEKDYLKEILKEIEWYANTQLHQPLNPKTRIYPASHGIDFGGYRIFRNRILPTQAKYKSCENQI